MASLAVALRGRCLWLLLASVCEAAWDGAADNQHAASLVPGNAADSTGSLFDETQALTPGRTSTGPHAASYAPATRGRGDHMCPDATIAHSNRTETSPCVDYKTTGPNEVAIEGTECFFSCDVGYMPLGRHVCQWHDPDFIRAMSKPEDHYVPGHNLEGWHAQAEHKYIFHGGLCAPLCGDNHDTQTCPSPQSPRRYRQSTLTLRVENPSVDCMETECFPDGRANLKNLARGIYEVMKIARDIRTGLYYNAVNFDWFKTYTERSNAAGEYATINGTEHTRCGSAEWLRQATQTYQNELGKNFSLDATAFGIMSEVLGTALGYQSPVEGAANVRDTLGNLTRNTPGADKYDQNGEFEFARDSRGFFSHFYVHRKQNTTSPLATSLLVNAALFARSYFSALAAGQRDPDVLKARGGEMHIEESERAGFERVVSSLGGAVMTLYDSIDFTSILCDRTTGLISPEGDGIPFTIGMDTTHPCGRNEGGSGAVLCENAEFHNQCGKSTAYPGADGMYNFSEAHGMVYLAYQQACGAQKAGECTNEHIELMWNRWQKRRYSPNHHYADSPILATQGGYMLQELWYTTSSFNNDTKYQELFYNHWLADQLYFKQALHAGKRGRYGLGEGPEAKWCNEQKTYQAVGLHEKNKAYTPGVREGLVLGAHSHCQAISANIVAAYAPINPTLIEQQLLMLLEDGEVVEPIPCTDHAILWRHSLFEEADGINDKTVRGREGRITIIDLAPALFGLSTFFLPDTNFYKKYSSHFTHNGAPDGETDLAVLRARRQRREAERAALTEAEEILVKCHALCDPNGLAAGDSSSSGEQCVIDCAATRMFAKTGGEPLAPQEAARPAEPEALAQEETGDDAKGGGEVSLAARVLLKCHTECEASGDAASACTMACAQRRLQSSNAEVAAAPVRASRAKVELKQGHARREATSHRKAEEILVECHALCDPSGLIFRGLYDAAGSPEQCTIDCAAARLHGEAFAGRASLAPPARPGKSTAGTAGLEQGEVSLAARVLLKCHAECEASSDDTSTCTMACAQGHLRRTSGASPRAGRANLTAAPRLVSNAKASEASRTKAAAERDPHLHGNAAPPPRGALAEDEDERDLIFKSRRR